jgi:hypothetical protein
MAVDKSALQRWHAMGADEVLCRLAEHVKEDPDFVPRGDPRTRRVYVNAAGHDWELLLTGAKWFDVQGGVGGGGAVDLAMHLWRLSFKQAVGVLVERKV